MDKLLRKFKGKSMRIVLKHGGNLKGEQRSSVYTGEIKDVNSGCVHLDEGNSNIVYLPLDNIASFYELRKTKD